MIPSFFTPGPAPRPLASLIRPTRPSVRSTWESRLFPHHRLGFFQRDGVRARADRTKPVTVVNQFSLFEGIVGWWKQEQPSFAKFSEFPATLRIGALRDHDATPQKRSLSRPVRLSSRGSTSGDCLFCFQDANVGTLVLGGLTPFS